METGIYQIQNVVNKKRYVGSAVNFKRRWAVHNSQLKHRKHVNKHLEAAWYKYGSDKFVFTIIENCPEDVLLLREQFYVDLLKPEYNIRLIVDNANCTGEDNPSCKLSWPLVKIIREKYSFGDISISEISEFYKCSKSCVQAIIQNTNWYDENYEYVPKEDKFWNKSIMKLNWTIVREIRKRYWSEKITRKVLMKKYTVSDSTIAKIIQNKAWKDASYIYDPKESCKRMGFASAPRKRNK